MEIALRDLREAASLLRPVTLRCTNLLYGALTGSFERRQVYRDARLHYFHGDIKNAAAGEARQRGAKFSSIYLELTRQ